MTCSCCQAKAFHGLSGLSQPRCSCSCPPSCGCGCRGSKSKKNKCRCNGNCMCGKAKASSDCSCGCGGTCGCGPTSAMGSFDEYPRPKAAMFDPRQLGQVWPEPHPDPLIPYVRANEGLLPYDSLNRYKGTPNSLHGYLAMGISPANSLREASYKGTKTLLSALSAVNSGYQYLYKDSEAGTPNEAKDERYVPPEIPAEPNFFAFVPVQRITKDRKNVFEIYIRFGGPEIKVADADDADDFFVKSGERKYLQQSLVDLEKEPLSWAKYIQGRISSQYPLVLSSFTKSFLPTCLTEGTPGASNAYSNSDKSHKILGEHILDLLVSSASQKYASMKNDDPEKAVIATFLEDILSVALTNRTPAQISSVAEGVAKAFVDRLKADFAYASQMGIQVFEWRNVIGSKKQTLVDERFNGVFRKTSILPATYDALEEKMREGLVKAFDTRKKALNQLYKSLFQSTGGAAVPAATESEQVLALQAENDSLRNEIEALRAGGSTPGATSEDKTQLEGRIASLSSDKEKAEEDLKFWKIGAVVLSGVGLAAGYLFHKSKTKKLIVR